MPEVDPNGNFVDGKNVVSHRNIGAWLRTCEEKLRIHPGGRTSVPH